MLQQVKVKVCIEQQPEVLLCKKDRGVHRHNSEHMPQTISEASEVRFVLSLESSKLYYKYNIFLSHQKYISFILKFM